MADIQRVFYSRADTPTDSFLVANCALLLEQVLSIKLDASVRNAIASSAGWVHTTYQQTSCTAGATEDSVLPPGGNGEGEPVPGNGEPHFLALAKNVSDLSIEVASMASDIASIKQALLSRERKRNVRQAGNDDAGEFIDDGGTKGSCYKYSGVQVIGSGVVSRYSVFTASAAAGFTSLAGSFSARGSLTVVSNYNFRFLLAPPNLTEGPSWDAGAQKWIIPWKDENGNDKEPVEPLVNRLCAPPKCSNDIVNGTAVALFDVVSAFFATAAGGASHLTTSAAMRAAVAGLTRTALVAPVTFTHSSGSATHQPLVAATPPPPPA